MVPESRLRELSLFASLTDAELKRVAEMAQLESHPKGVVLCRQGEPGEAFYLILSGQVRGRTVDKQKVEHLVGYLPAGAFLGAKALLTKKPYDRTIDTATDADLAVFDKESFRKLLIRHPQVKSLLLKEPVVPVSRLRASRLFASMSEADLQEVAEMARPAFFPAEVIICRQGERGDAFYVILSGRVQVSAVDEQGVERLLNYLSAGGFFGEISLLTGQPRTATIETVEDTELAVFERRVFYKLCTQHTRVRDFLQRTRVDFPGKHWGEVAEVFEYKHIYALLESLLLPALVSIIWIASILIGFSYLESRPLISLGGTAAVIILLAIWVAWLYVDWINDQYIVTSERVVHIERILPLGEERYEAPIAQVQYVETRTPNLIASLLGFKDLIIKTASMGTPITFARLPEAERIQQLIIEVRDTALTRHEAEYKGQRIQALRQQMGLPAAEEIRTPEMVKVPSAPFQERGIVERFFNYFVPRLREQRDNEVTWRKHWYVLVKQITAPLILLVTLLYLVVASTFDLLPFAPPEPIPFVPYLFLISLILLLADLAWLLWAYEDWRNDLYIVTDRLIVDRESAPFGFRETRNVGSIDDIQNISLNIPNVMAKILNLGDVFIDTKAGPKAFTFESVHNPASVQQDIFARLIDYQERIRREESEHRVDELSRWFGEYHQLRSSEEEPKQGPEPSDTFEGR